MRILLVEDDVGIGRVVRNGLRSHGFDVDWLREGRPVVTHLESGSYAAVVLDLMLPDSDGFEICKDARARGIATPICMLTARDDLECKLQGFGCGADDYLTKPFSVEELVARLKVMMRRSITDDATSKVVFGDLVIDLLAREACVGDDELELSQREFEVLLFLARHGGQAVTRDQLLRGAWGVAAEVTSNTVDVYVGYVRRKLQNTSRAPMIKTVRGVGFKLV